MSPCTSALPLRVYMMTDGRLHVRAALESRHGSNSISWTCARQRKFSLRPARWACVPALDGAVGWGSGGGSTRAVTGGGCTHMCGGCARMRS
eukprot:87427-Chlamydomonas_euryale.AAC.2